MLDAVSEAALWDLLTITALDQITPVRVQSWQQAARTALDIQAGAPTPPSEPLPEPSVEPVPRGVLDHN